MYTEVEQWLEGTGRNIKGILEIVGKVGGFGGGGFLGGSGVVA